MKLTEPPSCPLRWLRFKNINAQAYNENPIKTCSYRGLILKHTCSCALVPLVWRLSLHLNQRELSRDKWLNSNSLPFLIASLHLLSWKRCKYPCRPRTTPQDAWTPIVLAESLQSCISVLQSRQLPRSQTAAFGCQRETIIFRSGNSALKWPPNL